MRSPRHTAASRRVVSRASSSYARTSRRGATGCRLSASRAPLPARPRPRPERRASVCSLRCRGPLDVAVGVSAMPTRAGRETNAGTALPVRPTRSKLARAEGVAGLRPAAFEPLLEPAHALLGGAMGERFRHNPALRALLQRVIPDLGCGVEPVLDIARQQAVLDLIVQARPNTRKAVGLQLHAHLQLVDLALVAALQRPLLEALHLVGNAQQRLDVVADLVGDDVGLREVARRVKALLQLPVEVEIDVNLVVERAVEGPHCRLADATTGAYGAGEQHQLRLLVGLAAGLEHALPHVLRIGEHTAHEARHLIVLRRHAGLLGARELEGRAGARTAARDVRHSGGAFAAAQQFQRIDAEHQADAADDDERGDAQPTPADRDGNAASAAALEHAPALAAAVLHVVALPILFAVSHRVIPEARLRLSPLLAASSQQCDSKGDDQCHTGARPRYPARAILCCQIAGTVLRS